MTQHVGRTWRPLLDTAVAAQLLYEAPGASTNWRRSVDYYPEGELLWLDADMTIRSLTGGKKSLDDFTRSFYGGASGHPDLKPYTFDDILAAAKKDPSNWTLANPSNPSFKDVPKTNEFYQHIETAKAHGLLDGCATGQFCGYDFAKRGQLTKIISGALPTSGQ